MEKVEEGVGTSREKRKGRNGETGNRMIMRNQGEKKIERKRGHKQEEKGEKNIAVSVTIYYNQFIKLVSIHTHTHTHTHTC